MRKYSGWGAESTQVRSSPTAAASAATDISGSTITIRGACLLDPRSTDPTDRLILALGAITLLILGVWYAVAYAVAVLRVNVSGDLFALASFIIPSTGPTALLLLVGCGIQRYRRQPPVLFAFFVVSILVGWTTALAGNLWIFFGFRSGGGPSFSSLVLFFVIAGIAHLVGLFLLLVLALGPRPSGPIPQPANPPPVDPIL